MDDAGGVDVVLVHPSLPAVMKLMRSKFFTFIIGVVSFAFSRGRNVETSAIPWDTAICAVKGLWNSRR